MCDNKKTHTTVSRRTMLGGLSAAGLSAYNRETLADNRKPQAGGQKLNPGLQQMMEAAQAFLNLLSKDLQRQAVFPLSSDEVSNWHYIPTYIAALPNAAQMIMHKRNGVSIKEMSLEQRLAAHALLRSALGTQGYLKATAIMHLELVLREIEITLGRNVKEATAIRDPELYFFTVFGTPSKEDAWGWRVEGHHLSLHFALLGNRFIAPVPAFMGSNPAIVKHGSHAGSRLFAAEETLARELLQSFNAPQSSQVMIDTAAPNDIITKNHRRAELGKPTGLSVAKMSGAQREVLMRLIQEYVGNFTADLAASEFNRIKAEGIEKIHFAWAGSSAVGKAHYYRIHSPKLLIEYDNTQNDANHIHTVYRQPDNDFGLDMLRQHYDKSSHHRGVGE
ncbi:MAG: DUF3500 domain-containing protein [Acidobacteria bacterium]|nr:DUF3500 domain-containing protein [Acidobacteriota bacterium]